MSIRAFYKYGQYFLDGRAIARSYTQNRGGDPGRRAVDGVAMTSLKSFNTAVSGSATSSRPHVYHST